MVTLMVVTPVRAHRDALATCLNGQPDLQVVHLAATVAEAVGGAVTARPEVTLLDLGAAAATTVCVLHRAAPGTRIVGYGVPRIDGAGQQLIDAARAGAQGFVDVDQSPADLGVAIRAVARGDLFCSPRLAGLLLHAVRSRPVNGPPGAGLSQDAVAVLTGRERVVAELVVSGLTNRQIAAQLVLSEATVKSHVHSLLRKLGATSRADVRFWFAHTTAATPSPRPARLDPAGRG